MDIGAAHGGSLQKTGLERDKMVGKKILELSCRFGDLEESLEQEKWRRKGDEGAGTVAGEFHCWGRGEMREKEDWVIKGYVGPQLIEPVTRILRSLQAWDRKTQRMKHVRK